MCAGAIINSRIRKIYIGALEPKSGACVSKLKLMKEYDFDTQVELETKILNDECQKILKEFFKERRKENKAKG